MTVDTVLNATADLLPPGSAVDTVIPADLLVLGGLWAGICLLFAVAGAICDPDGLYDRAADLFDRFRSRAADVTGGGASRPGDPDSCGASFTGSGPPRPGPAVSTGFPPFPDGRPVPDNTPEVHA